MKHGKQRSLEEGAEKGYLITEDLLEISVYLKSREMGPTQ